MTPVEVFVEGHSVHLTDENGPAVIPARVVHLLSHTASQSTATNPGASWGPRWFDRDALLAARELLDNTDKCTHEDRFGSCDEPAPHDLRDPRPLCATHKRNKD